MSFNIKTTVAQFGYRLSSITLSEDGTISASLQIGTISKGNNDETIFTQVANQGYYITKDEADKLFLEIDDSLSLRDAVSAVIESHLRQKGQLTI